MAQAGDAGDREIVITRVFQAPRELVWEAWTDPKQVVQWWGPRGFTTTIHEMEVRPGGVWRHTMHGPDGTDYPNKSVFLEVVKPERIVYSHGGGKQGGPGAQFQATWTFEAQGDNTKLTMRLVFPSAEARDRVVKEFGAIEGGEQTLDRLGEHLPKKQTKVQPFIITRVFDAPLEVVWKAWTEPERLKQWFGPKGFTMPACTMDLRPGSVFHYGLRSPDGRDIWGRWVFRDIVTLERLVFVVSFSDALGRITRHPLSAGWPLETLSTVTFAGGQGRTAIRVQWAPLNATEEERRIFDTGHDGMLQGWTGTFDQLADHLAKVRSA